MPKTVMPSFEPMPYYMSLVGMQGARFVEGNDGSGTPGTPGTPGGTGEGDAGKSGGAGGDAGKPNGDDLDGFKSKESKDAVLADLTKEREDRKKYQAEAETANGQVTDLTAQVTAHEATIVERDNTIAAKDSEISVLKLAVENGVSGERNLNLLRAVTDESARADLAKVLSSKSSPVPPSGTGGAGNGGAASGGSIAERRREIRERKTK